MAEENNDTVDEVVAEEPKSFHEAPDLLLFGKWDSTTVEVKDPGLIRYSDRRRPGCLRN